MRALTICFQHYSISIYRGSLLVTPQIIALSKFSSVNRQRILDLIFCKAENVDSH